MPTPPLTLEEQFVADVEGKCNFLDQAIRAVRAVIVTDDNLITYEEKKVYIEGLAQKVQTCAAELETLMQ